MHTIRLERTGSTAALVIDRAERRNALTQDMWEQVPLLLAPLTDDPTLQLLVVRSATPGVFSAGADVVEYRDNAGDADWGRRSQHRVGSALQAIRDVPAPTLAVVDGACIGGGGGIALACDFRISSTRGTFGFPPAKLGLVFPIEDTVQLVRLVGPATAKRMLFTGETFSAAWAESAGLVDELCAVDDLDEVVDRWVAALTSTAPGSVRSMKRIIALVQDGLVSGNEETAAMVDAALSGAEHREGVSAFLERRPANFIG
jgi:enoyl-CoA hydratase/carnithine racemase